MKAKKPKSRRKKRYQRGEYTSTKSGLTCRFRSGWEFVYMQHLDANELVVDWFYEALKIDYVSNKKTGRLRKYIPDFVVNYTDGHTDIIEIKPKRKLSNAVVVKKTFAAREWCVNNGKTYILVTEVELKALGLL